MKTINVNLHAFYGFGCGCGSYSSDATATIEITDDAAATIDSLRAENEQIDQDVLGPVIEAGHAELAPVLDAIKERHTDMVVRYWLFEAYNECLDETLEPAFWKDIEEGRYQPEESFADFPTNHSEDMDCADYDFEDEDELRECYYENLRENYLDWLKGLEDYKFVAERVGLDLEAVMEDLPELEFEIEK